MMQTKRHLKPHMGWTLSADLSRVECDATDDADAGYPLTPEQYIFYPTILVVRLVVARLLLS